MPLGILEQQRLVAEGLRLVRRYTSDLWFEGVTKVSLCSGLGENPHSEPRI